jgi:hypothetical protein
MSNKVIASTVYRGAKHGDSHGGLYIVDFDSNKVVQMLDWKGDISWGGRGGDRGLRGLAVAGSKIYVAAAHELLLFTPKFEFVGSVRNPYLRNCHEIALHKGLLFLTSSGHDSVLIFDTASNNFVAGLQLAREGSEFRAITFDPNRPGGPAASSANQLNSVYVDDGGIYLAGRNLNMLLRVFDNQVTSIARLPLNTNNARPFSRGLLFNDTGEDQLTWVGPSDVFAFDVPRYPVKKLTHIDMEDSAMARQAFARGLCLLSENLVAGGSSPATICIYDLDKRVPVKSVNLTMNVRIAVHGIAAWPY